MHSDFEVLAEIRRPAHASGAKRTVQRCPAAVVMGNSGLELQLQLLEPVAQGSHVRVEIALFADTDTQTIVRLQGPALAKADGTYVMAINRRAHLLRQVQKRTT